jgi:hypothetical protein
MDLHSLREYAIPEATFGEGGALQSPFPRREIPIPL